MFEKQCMLLTRARLLLRQSGSYDSEIRSMETRAWCVLVFYLVFGVLFTCYKPLEQFIGDGVLAVPLEASSSAAGHASQLKHDVLQRRRLWGIQFKGSASDIVTGAVQEGLDKVESILIGEVPGARSLLGAIHLQLGLKDGSKDEVAKGVEGFMDDVKGFLDQLNAQEQKPPAAQHDGAAAPAPHSHDILPLWKKGTNRDVAGFVAYLTCYTASNREQVVQSLVLVKSMSASGQNHTFMQHFNASMLLALQASNTKSQSATLLQCLCEDGCTGAGASCSHFFLVTPWWCQCDRTHQVARYVQQHHAVAEPGLKSAAAGKPLPQPSRASPECPFPEKHPEAPNKWEPPTPESSPSPSPSPSPANSSSVPLTDRSGAGLLASVCLAAVVAGFFAW
jgi:hypothetical protein